MATLLTYNLNGVVGYHDKVKTWLIETFGFQKSILRADGSEIELPSTTLFVGDNITAVEAVDIHNQLVDHVKSIDPSFKVSHIAFMASGRMIYFDGPKHS